MKVDAQRPHQDAAASDAGIRPVEQPVRPLRFRRVLHLNIESARFLLNDEGVRDSLKHARQGATKIQFMSSRRKRPQHDVVAVCCRGEDPNLWLGQSTKVETATGGLTMFDQIIVANSIDVQQQVGDLFRYPSGCAHDCHAVRRSVRRGCDHVIDEGEEQVLPAWHSASAYSSPCSVSARKEPNVPALLAGTKFSCAIGDWTLGLFKRACPLPPPSRPFRLTYPPNGFVWRSEQWLSGIRESAMQESQGKQKMMTHVLKRRS